MEGSWVRHQRHHMALKASFEAMGLRYLVKESNRQPQIHSDYVLDGLLEGTNAGGEAQARKTLLNDFNLEIGAGLGLCGNAQARCRK